MNDSAAIKTASVVKDQNVERDAVLADTSPVEVVATSSPTSEQTRLKVITAQLADDMRPLVDRVSAVPDRARPLIERARPMADVFLPLVDEMRPLMDDLRPVVQDLRALFAELVIYVKAASARIALIDLGPARSVVRVIAGGARRVAGVRPTASAMPRPSIPRPSLSLGIRAPRVGPAIRLPSIGLRFPASLRPLAARLRPGRWMFRVAAIGVIAAALSNATLRDAMVAEITWTRSAVQTIEMPQVEMPAIEIPKVELPAIEMPKVELPALQLPNIDLSALQSAIQDSTSPKLVPAQFELPPLDAYGAAFQSQAPYPTVSPNGAVEWVVALRNTGSVGWYRGVAGAQASLALTDGTEAAVQTTPYVAPGQVGWFVVRFRAPAGPGTHTVALKPRIDGRGDLPDLGLFTVVTVR